jgi:hypothetical protein
MHGRWSSVLSDGMEDADMARPEVTGRKAGVVERGQDVHRIRGPPPIDDFDAFPIAEFCRRHGISPQLFYKLKPQGLMPPTFRLGARVLISREAAAAWRREREAASQAAETTDPLERKRRPIGRL